MGLIEPIEVTLKTNIDEKGKLKDPKRVGRIFASRALAGAVEIDGQVKSEEVLLFGVSWFNRLHEIQYFKSEELISLGPIVDHSVDARVADFDRRLTGLNKFAEELVNRLDDLEADVGGIEEHLDLEDSEGNEESVETPRTIAAQ